MSTAMSMVQRARAMSGNCQMAPLALRHALSRLESRPCIDHVYDKLQDSIDRCGTFVLAGPPRVGKTVAMYFAFVMYRSITIEQELDRQREQWRVWQYETRPLVLATGPPEEPLDGGDVGAAASRVMYQMALRRYQSAMAGSEEPDWAEIERVAMRSPIRFDNIYRASDIIRLAWDDKSWVETLRRTDTLLGIDDMGTEYMTDRGWQLALWDDLFDHRHRHQLPTMITTNLDVPEFRERYSHPTYGERIWGRIKENGRYVWEADA